MSIHVFLICEDDGQRLFDKKCLFPKILLYHKTICNCAELIAQVGLYRILYTLFFYVYYYYY